MMKLSSLTDETLLIVRWTDDEENSDVMTKLEFLTWYIRMEEPYHSVCLASQEPALFDFSDIERMVENNQDDQYECWAEDMLDSIRDTQELNDFLAFMNKAAIRNMTYIVGEEVDVDV